MLHHKSCSSETGLPPNRNKCRLVVVSAATAVFVRSSRSEQQVRHQQLITVAAGEELVIKQWSGSGSWLESCWNVHIYLIRNCVLWLLLRNVVPIPPVSPSQSLHPQGCGHPSSKITDSPESPSMTCFPAFQDSFSLTRWNKIRYRHRCSQHTYNI